MNQAKKTSIYIEPDVDLALARRATAENATDDHHDEVGEWLAGVDDDLATTPPIIAEVDHLVAARGGRRALAALRADLTAGAVPGRGLRQGPGAATDG